MKIDAWKLADDLTVEVYQMTRSFPKEAGVLPKVIASITSLIVLCVARASGGPIVP
jgi:hypothetical protein